MATLNANYIHLPRFYVQNPGTNTNKVTVSIYSNTTETLAGATLIYSRTFTATELNAFSNDVGNFVSVDLTIDVSLFLLAQYTGVGGLINNKIEIDTNYYTGNVSFAIGCYGSKGWEYDDSIGGNNTGAKLQLVKTDGTVISKDTPYWIPWPSTPLVLPSNPIPNDESTEIGLTYPFLTWTPNQFGAYAEIYFGDTEETMELVETVYDIDFSNYFSEYTFNNTHSAWVASTVKYWRVDTIFSAGDTLTGTVWSFTTKSTEQTASVENRANYSKEARVWLSKTGDYDNFQEGVKDNDSFSLVVPSKNEMSWLGGLESLLLGTSGDEWRIGSNKLDTPLTPLNATIKQQTEWGSNRIKPIKINAALIFVNFTSLVLREMAWLDSKYESPDLTVLAEHITKTGVTTMSRQKEPDSILWLTLADGKLVSFTYNREQNVLAFAEHPLGGDGFAMSVCVTPGVPEDNVTLSVGRTIDGTEVTYIERMKPRKYNTISDCFFVDCGITATRATETSIVTGLSHLEGCTVKLLVDGVEADEDVVEDGQVTVSFAGVASVTWTTAHVGLAYTSLLQPLRIVVGDSHGAITKVPELNASFLDTGAASYGNDSSDVKAIDFTQIGLINTSDITGLYTGQVKLTMAGAFSVENPIYISSDKPLPLCVRALMCRIEKTSR